MYIYIHSCTRIHAHIHTYIYIYIQFKDSRTAKAASNHGFQVHHIPVYPNNIRIDAYKSARQCYRCYSFDHSTGQCRKNQQCSTCQGAHHYRSCPNLNNPFCRNCNTEGHSAVDRAKCPILKHHVKSNAKRETVAQRNHPESRNRYTVAESWVNHPAQHHQNQVHQYNGQMQHQQNAHGHQSHHQAQSAQQYHSRPHSSHNPSHHPPPHAYNGAPYNHVVQHGTNSFNQTFSPTAAGPSHPPHSSQPLGLMPHPSTRRKAPRPQQQPTYNNGYYPLSSPTTYNFVPRGESPARGAPGSSRGHRGRGGRGRTRPSYAPAAPPLDNNNYFPPGSKLPTLRANLLTATPISKIGKQLPNPPRHELSMTPATILFQPQLASYQPRADRSFHRQPSVAPPNTQDLSLRPITSTPRRAAATLPPAHSPNISGPIPMIDLTFSHSPSTAVQAGAHQAPTSNRAALAPPNHSSNKRHTHHPSQYVHLDVGFGPLPKGALLPTPTSPQGIAGYAPNRHNLFAQVTTNLVHTTTQPGQNFNFGSDAPPPSLTVSAANPPAPHSLHTSTATLPAASATTHTTHALPASIPSIIPPEDANTALEITTSTGTYLGRPCSRSQDQGQEAFSHPADVLPNGRRSPKDNNSKIKSSTKRPSEKPKNSSTNTINPAKRRNTRPSDQQNQSAEPIEEMDTTYGTAQSDVFQSPSHTIPPPSLPPQQTTHLSTSGHQPQATPPPPPSNNSTKLDALINKLQETIVKTVTTTLLGLLAYKGENNIGYVLTELLKANDLFAPNLLGGSFDWSDFMPPETARDSHNTIQALYHVFKSRQATENVACQTDNNTNIEAVLPNNMDDSSYSNHLHNSPATIEMHHSTPTQQTLLGPEIRSESNAPLHHHALPGILQTPINNDRKYILAFHSPIQATASPVSFHEASEFQDQCHKKMELERIKAMQNTNKDEATPSAAPQTTPADPKEPPAIIAASPNSIQSSNKEATAKTPEPQTQDKASLTTPSRPTQPPAGQGGPDHVSLQLTQQKAPTPPKIQYSQGAFHQKLPKPPPSPTSPKTGVSHSQTHLQKPKTKIPKTIQCQRKAPLTTTMNNSKTRARRDQEIAQTTNLHCIIPPNQQMGIQPN